jgi:hypothetical protein
MEILIVAIVATLGVVAGLKKPRHQYTMVPYDEPRWVMPAPSHVNPLDFEEIQRLNSQ